MPRQISGQAAWLLLLSVRRAIRTVLVKINTGDQERFEPPTT